jgi:hypothetical protein
MEVPASLPGHRQPRDGEALGLDPVPSCHTAPSCLRRFGANRRRSTDTPGSVDDIVGHHYTHIESEVPVMLCSVPIRQSGTAESSVHVLCGAARPGLEMLRRKSPSPDFLPREY